ncbi:RNA binding methyltransferase FtsJ like [hydrothermal vent metagenome]|uniref:RNA binding methyltransferase FtsJ like n=1 Tax=hydrothermal vent metagenome TaxID=652676 RepID=A0A3B0QPZ3_9ZZZZ
MAGNFNDKETEKSTTEKSSDGKSGSEESGAEKRQRPVKPKKVRIDVLITELGLVKSRQRAQALIMAGRVVVNEHRVDKAGTKVDPQARIVVKEDLPYVGRGGLKLKGALDGFGIDPSGLIAMDVGSSTGGFTDCLLQAGAEKVYAIDVGKGLIDYSLRTDERVVLLESVNIRYLEPEAIPDKAGIVVIDVSFISLKKVLPVLQKFLGEKATVLALVKPQFEVGKGQLGKGGIVKDPEKHRAVVEDMVGFAEAEGYAVLGTVESPIKGAKGNKEFWLYLSSRR